MSSLTGARFVGTEMSFDGFAGAVMVAAPSTVDGNAMRAAFLRSLVDLVPLQRLARL